MSRLRSFHNMYPDNYTEYKENIRKHWEHYMTIKKLQKDYSMFQVIDTTMDFKLIDESVLFYLRYAFIYVVIEGLYKVNDDVLFANIPELNTEIKSYSHNIESGLDEHRIEKYYSVLRRFRNVCFHVPFDINSENIVDWNITLNLNPYLFETIEGKVEQMVNDIDELPIKVR